MINWRMEQRKCEINQKLYKLEAEGKKDTFEYRFLKDLLNCIEDSIGAYEAGFYVGILGF